MKKRLLLLSVALTGSAVTARKANAIPPYAKQMGVECSQCHTVWPQLNSYGRRFKVKGYIDSSSLGEPWMPLALRMKVSYESQKSSTNGIVNSQTDLLSLPREVNLFAGGKITSDLGAFVEITAHKDPANGWVVEADQIKLAYNISKEHPASIVLMKSGTFGADPMPSLGGMDRHPFSSDAFQPLFQTNGSLMATGDSNNYALIAHAYFGGGTDNWYAAGGVQTGGSVVDPTLGSNVVSHGPAKGYLRLAYDMPVGSRGGSANFGGAYFWGGTTVNMPAGSPLPQFTGQTSRLYLDTALQLPMMKNDLLELVGIYTNGRDYNLRQFQNAQYLSLANAGALDPSIQDPIAAQLSGPQTIDVRGIHLQGNYYFNRTWGPILSYDNTNVAGVNTKTWQAGVAWLPTQDFKVALNAQWAKDDQGNKNTLVGLYLTKYFWEPLHNETEENVETKTPPDATTPAATPGTSVQICPNCKAENSKNAKYCSQCGQALPTASLLPPPSSLPTVNPAAQVAAVPGSPTRTGPSAPSDPPSLASGKKLYRTNCAVCHGLDGKGDKEMLKSLNPKPRNFATEKFAHGDSDKEIFDTISNGSPGSAMASFSGKLSDEQRWQLTAYVKLLGGKK